MSAEPANTRLFVLALGLLVGSVIAFVAVLSRLPVATSLSDGPVTELEGTAAVDEEDYEFYTLLARERAASAVAAEPTAESPVAVPVIPPATRIVPGDAQSLDRRGLASERYAEIPASSLGQESYYLQAGNFPEPGDAERARAAVLLLGLDAFVVTRQDVSGVTSHRVRIGPFFDQHRLTEAKRRLRGASVPYDIIRVTG